MNVNFVNVSKKLFHRWNVSNNKYIFKIQTSLVRATSSISLFLTSERKHETPRFQLIDRQAVHVETKTEGEKLKSKSKLLLPFSDVFNSLYG